MIFLTVGTSNFSFNRLLELIDQLCEDGILNGEEIVAQIGISEYRPLNYRFFDMLSTEKHKEIIDESEYVITHAGTGSIISSLKMDKKIIAFPRMKKYNEHIDDHQLELVRAFLKRNYILSATTKSEMITALSQVKDFKPQKFVSNTKKFELLLEDILFKL